MELAVLLLCPDVGLDELPGEAVEGILETVWNSLPPVGEDEFHDLGRDQFHREERQEHDAAFGLLGLPDCLGRLTCSLRDSPDDWISFLPDDLREMEEACFHRH